MRPAFAACLLLAALDLTAAASAAYRAQARPAVALGGRAGASTLQLARSSDKVLPASRLASADKASL